MVVEVPTLALRVSFLGLMICCCAALLWLALDVESGPSMHGEQRAAFASLPPLLKGEDRVVEIKIKKGAVAVDLGLQPTGWWWMIKPKFTMANQDLADAWLQQLSRSKVQRILGASEWVSQADDESWQVELVGLDTQLTLVRVLRMQIKGYEFFKLPDGRVLKVEQKRPLDWPEDSFVWRSKRVFPFALAAVKTINCRVKQWQRTLIFEEGRWKTTEPVHPGWGDFLKGFPHRHLCRGFVDDFEPEGQALAHHEITFESGDRSLLELFQGSNQQWIVSYRGQSMGHVLSEAQKRSLFPEWTDRS